MTKGNGYNRANSNAIKRRAVLIREINEYINELEKAIITHYELIEQMNSNINQLNEILSKIKEN